MFRWILGILGKTGITLGITFPITWTGYENNRHNKTLDDIPKDPRSNQTGGS